MLIPPDSYAVVRCKIFFVWAVPVTFLFDTGRMLGVKYVNSSNTVLQPLVSLVRNIALIGSSQYYMLM